MQTKSSLALPFTEFMSSRLKACGLNLKQWGVLAICSILVACSSSPSGSKGAQRDGQSGRYQMANDRAPDNAPDVSKVPNAVPKYEPYSRQGNKDYRVLGKNYAVLRHGKDFRQRGIASWYGSKFHGHLTSNGEVYDMYTMSAAHKTLPIPSYVKVRNEDNNKEIIVRVNDRGPFHEGRIIDLSYAAAYKLGVLSTGTARVNIEAIYFPTPTSRALAELADPHVNFIQITASRDKVRIHHLAQQLETKYAVSSNIEPVNGFYRLRLGPIGQRHIADKLLQNLKRDGFPDSFMIEQAKP